MCLVMWINTTVATGLQTTHMNFISVLCVVDKWQCGVKFILMALLVLISLRMYRGIQPLCMQSGTQSRWKHFSAMSYILVSKICCGSNKMEKLVTQQKFPCKSSGQCFQADSFLILGTSLGPPTGLTMHYQTTSSGAMLKARYMKHVLPILLT